MMPRTASWAFLRTSAFLSSKLEYKWGMHTISSSFGIFFTTYTKYNFESNAIQNTNIFESLNNAILSFLVHFFRLKKCKLLLTKILRVLRLFQLILLNIAINPVNDHLRVLLSHTTSIFILIFYFKI